LQESSGKPLSYYLSAYREKQVQRQLHLLNEKVGFPSAKSQQKDLLILMKSSRSE